MRKSFEDKHQGLDNRFEVLLSGTTRIKKRVSKEYQKQNARNSTMYYLGFVGELGFAISIPIVLCALLGKYLDGIWLTYPKMTLSLLLVGCAISIINFVEIIKTIIKKSKN
jgi:predicted membrane protein